MGSFDDEDEFIEENEPRSFLSPAEQLAFCLAEQDALIRIWVEAQSADQDAGQTKDCRDNWLARAFHALVAPNIRILPSFGYFDKDGMIGPSFSLSPVMFHRFCSLETLFPDHITWGDIASNWDIFLPWSEIPPEIVIPTDEEIFSEDGSSEDITSEDCTA
jgi:hypothetical protein